MRIAAFDVSHWHVPLYLPALAAPSVEMVGISDAENFAGEALARRLGCPLLPGDALMTRDFDFALVFSRHSVMARRAHALIAAHRPFLIEKPCGLNLAEVQGVEQAAAAAGVFVTVPFILRVSNLVDHLTQTGSLSPSGYRDLSFRFIVGPLSRYESSGSRWMLDPTIAGGGSAINVGVHFYDLVAALTASPVVSVSGRTCRFRADAGVEELAAFSLTTASGQVANVTTGYLYPTSAKDQREFSFSVAHEAAYLQGHRGTLTVKRAGEQVVQHLTVEYDTDVFYPPFLADALARVRDGRPPLVGLAEAARAIAVVEAGYRSAARCGTAEAVVGVTT